MERDICFDVDLAATIIIFFISRFSPPLHVVLWHGHIGSRSWGEDMHSERDSGLLASCIIVYCSTGFLTGI